MDREGLYSRIGVVQNYGNGIAEYSSGGTNYKIAVNSSHAAAEVYRGASNNNGFSGLNLNVVTDQFYGGTVGSYIRFERAIGKRNRQSGLAI